jgi:hypothetical protein
MRRTTLTIAVLLVTVLLSAQIAGPHSFTLTQGQAWTETLTIKTNLGAAVNLTGYTAKAQIRPSPQSSTVLAEITCTFATDRTTGVVVISLTGTQTAALPANSAAVWDMFITDGSGNALRILQGQVATLARVTR